MCWCHPGGWGVLLTDIMQLVVASGLFVVSVLYFLLLPAITRYTRLSMQLSLAVLSPPILFVL